MTTVDVSEAWRSSDQPVWRQSLAWAGPFGVFIAWLALDKFVPLVNPWREIARDGLMVVVIAVLSWRVLPRRVPYWPTSIAIGVAVCALWIAPDALVPGWRDSVLFQNAITGRVISSIPAGEFTPFMLVLRTTRAALIVPLAEEMFWRGWLPRWLQNPHFERVPLGHYTRFTFWGTALLFAAEHGPYWEVGLVCGLIYNWWMRRTRSLGDLVLVHATTNLVLALYVIATQQWAFWM